jgi:hypothetical protein
MKEWIISSDPGRVKLDLLILVLHPPDRPVSPCGDARDQVLAQPARSDQQQRNRKHQQDKRQHECWQIGGSRLLRLGLREKLQKMLVETPVDHGAPPVANTGASTKVSAAR